MARKPEYPSLLPFGRHPYSLSTLRVLCVDAFPASTRRGALMNGLGSVLHRLVAADISGAVWVNGSFLTKKEDPNDVDLLLCLDSTFYAGASAEQRAAIEWLLSDEPRQTHSCDSYYWVDYPEGHELYEESEYNKASYLAMFGWTDDFIERKGIAVVSLPDGV